MRRVVGRLWTWARFRVRAGRDPGSGELTVTLAIRRWYLWWIVALHVPALGLLVLMWLSLIVLALRPPP